MPTNCKSRNLLGDKVITPCRYGLHTFEFASVLKRKGGCAFGRILRYKTFYSSSLKEKQFKGTQRFFAAHKPQANNKKLLKSLIHVGQALYMLKLTYYCTHIYIPARS